MEISVITASAQETEQLGERIGRSLEGKELIAMYGGLGMGKTTFTRGLATGLGIDANDVSSPTFALVHEHSGRVKLCHFDMYRVDGWDDLYSTGFFDYIGTGVMIIEWSENIEGALPEDAIRIRIEQLEDEKRKFTIEYKGGGAIEAAFT